jgi:hypothetical protein
MEPIATHALALVQTVSPKSPIGAGYVVGPVKCTVGCDTKDDDDDSDADADEPPSPRKAMRKAATIVKYAESRVTSRFHRNRSHATPPGPTALLRRP